MERLTERFMHGLGVKDCYDSCSVCDVAVCCGLLEDILEKLAHYEDLEEQLEKLYGGKMPLDEVVENLNRIVQNGEEKLDYARILTNAEAEKWDKWKDLEEQGRLIELPCAVGDTVYVINKHCPSPWKKEYCDDARNILPKDPCSVCPHRTAYIAPGKYNLKYLTRESEIFYTKEAAEAKLKEMDDTK